jgi:hypothetical protein
MIPVLDRYFARTPVRIGNCLLLGVIKANLVKRKKRRVSAWTKKLLAAAVMITFLTSVAMAVIYYGDDVDSSTVKYSAYLFSHLD